MLSPVFSRGAARAHAEAHARAHALCVTPPQGLLENFSKNPGLATPFYKAYYLQLLREARVCLGGGSVRGGRGCRARAHAQAPQTPHCFTPVR